MRLLFFTGVALVILLFGYIIQKPLLIFSFLSGIVLTFFFQQTFIYVLSTKTAIEPFFSSMVFRYMLGKKGIDRFRRKVVASIKQLQDYRIFVIQNHKILSYPDLGFTFTPQQISQLDKIFHDSLNDVLYLSSHYEVSFTRQPRDLSCYAYSYNVPVFNSRIVILAYFKPQTLPSHDDILVANDVAAMLYFAAEASGDSNTVMQLLEEVAWQSPYALGVCSPKGELIVGNSALYQLFKGTVPNFMELTDPEVFLLLLDGKKVGKTFPHDGQSIHLDAYPLHNKNYLVTGCLFIFYDAQVEYKQDLLGDSNTLKRFTSAHPSIGTAMFTTDGALLYSNESFMTHLGIVKVREAKQKNIFSLFKIEPIEFQKIVNQILLGHIQNASFYGVEKDLEFSVQFKGIVFGDKTIIETILEDSSVFSNVLPSFDNETEELIEELKTARSVQEHILALPPIYRPGVSVETRYIPYNQLSGDFFAIVPFNNDELGFIMADVSGHGVSASLITAALKILSQFAPNDENNLPKIIDYFNTYLADILPEGSFVTLFYGIVNFQKNTLRYINCGHPFPLLENLTTDEISPLDSMGFPLGGLLNISYDELVSTVQLPQKSRILLYTDGLFHHFTGTMNEKIETLSSIMRQNKNVNTRKFLDTTYRQLVERNTIALEDDVSMMLLTLDQTRTWKHSITISSTLLAVDTTIEETSKHIQKETELSTSLFWKIKTCLYETLLNAVVHGNKYNTQKFVYMDYRIYDELVAIRVRDEGTGFDYADAEDPFDPENSLKDFGRGIAMVKHLADSIRFNKKGNEITLFFYRKGKP